MEGARREVLQKQMGDEDMIPVFSNTLGDEELEAIRKVFASRWLGRGSECNALECELAAHLKVDRILLTNCCTSALYVGLRALGLPEGSEVIVPTVNFIACASVLIELGLKPVFADVHLHTLNILPSEIIRLRTPRTSAVLLLHYGGHPCDMENIWPVSEGLYIVEDAANAVASVYKGVACGTLGDMGVWSFDAMKELVMADGRALWLKNEKALEKAECLRYLGLASKSKSGMDSLGEQQKRWWEYSVEAASGRFISNDVAAAMGRVQLKKLPDFISRRKEIWDYYQQELDGVGDLVLPPEPLQGCTTSYYFYWLQTALRDKLAQYLVSHDIYVTYRYFPLHLVRFFRSYAELPHAEFISEHTLNIPLHQNLTDAQVEHIIDAIKEFYS